MTTKKTTTRKKLSEKNNQKKSAKKTTKKVAIKKAVGKNANNNRKLVVATGANCFWVHNGPILRDLVELEEALNDMTEKMFLHHVSRRRNDFADWIEVILKDSETAMAFRKAKKPQTARAIVLRQLKLYQLANKK